LDVQGASEKQSQWEELRVSGFKRQAREAIVVNKQTQFEARREAVGGRCTDKANWPWFRSAKRTPCGVTTSALPCQTKPIPAWMSGNGRGPVGPGAIMRDKGKKQRSAVRDRLAVVRTNPMSESLKFEVSSVKLQKPAVWASDFALHTWPQATVRPPRQGSPKNCGVFPKSC
jgi:hypothetical protein